MNKKKLKRVVIKEELVALTGDYIKALILNQFIYWSERTNEFDQFIAEERERDPDIVMDLSHGWIYKKADELIDELMVKMSTNTIRRHIKKLVEDGYLHERNNPKHKWDRVLQYRPDIVKIQTDLHNLGYALADYPLIHANVILKVGTNAMKVGTSHSDGAIPENTNTDYLRDISLEKKLSESEPFSVSTEDMDCTCLDAVASEFRAQVVKETALKLDTQIMGEEDELANVFGDNPRQNEIDIWQKRPETNKDELLLHAMTGGVGLDVRRWEGIINDSGWKLADKEVRAIAFFQVATEGYFALPTAKDRRGRWKNGINQHLDEAAFEGRLEELYVAIWKELGPDIKTGKLTLYTTPGSFTNQMYSVMQRMAFEDSSEGKPLTDEQGALIL